MKRKITKIVVLILIASFLCPIKSFGKKTYPDKGYVKIVGQVQKPGLYEFKRGLTFYDVVSLAGGFLPGYNLKKTVIFRNEEESISKINVYDKLIDEMWGDSSITDQIYLEDGDIIYVKGSSRAKGFLLMFFGTGIGISS